MALNIIKAARYMSFFLARLEEETVLLDTITKFDGGNFRGAKDDTINFKLKRIAKARDYEFRTRTAPIVVDDITQVTIAIVLDTHTYSAVGITDEELTLDVTNFVTEIVDPQVTAIVERLEGKVGTALAAAPWQTDDIALDSDKDPYLMALDIQEAMDDQHAPKRGRIWVVGSHVNRWILGSDRISQPAQSGSTTALRDAIPGRIAGLTVVNAAHELDPDEWYCYHPSALVMANVAPLVPQGAAYGARRSERGISMRLIRDYDSNYARDRSFINTFTGISSVNDATNPSTGALLNLNPRGVTGTFDNSP